MIRQALRLVVINLSVLAAFLVLAELASRGYESLVYKPKYQNELEKQLSEVGDSCHHPPILTDGGNLSRYKEDFSCGGVTVVNGLRLTSGQPESRSAGRPSGRTSGRTSPSERRSTISKRSIERS